MGKNNDSSELKSLQSAISKAKDSVVTIDKEIGRLTKKRDEQNKLIEELNRKIEKLTKRNIVITEHSLLRYLERVKGIDLEQIKKEILTEDVIKKHEMLGDAEYPVDKTFSVVIRDNSVVTVKTY